MATLNFPLNPALNQIYTFGGKTWVWNGQGWQLSSSGAINNIPIGNVTPAAGTFTVVTAVGNVVGNYFIGNGSQLTGISANYSNANVAAYLPYYSGNLPNLTGSVSTTGNLTGGNIRTVGSVSATGNITGNYFVGNGSQLTGIVAEAGAAITNGDSNVRIPGANADVTVSVDGVANVAVFASDQVNFAGNLIPVANSVYSLGNSTNQWKDIWVSNATIYLGNVPINMSANSVMLIDGEPVLTNDGTQPIVTTGNVSADYFIGDGSLLTGISTNTGNIANGTSSIDIAAANANITVNVNGTSNVAVFTPTGVSVTGNITANNLSGNGAALTSVMTDRGTDPSNWNTLTQMGVYTVNRVSWSGTVGTPLDSQVFVGLLEVKNSTGTAIEQIFFPGTVENSDQKIQWNRANWGGIWTGWIKIVNDYQTVVGGEF